MKNPPRQIDSTRKRPRFVSRIVHHFAMCVLMLAVTSILGCNSSGGGASSTGDTVGSSSNPVAVPTALPEPGSVVVDFPARPSGVTRVVVVGFDTDNHPRFGPHAAPWAPRVTLSDVPLSVTSLLIMTASDADILQAFSQAVALHAGRTTVIDDPEKSSARLVELGLEEPTLSVALGTTLAFSALGLFTDGRDFDLTPYVRWTSSDPNVATISSSAPTWGTATALAGGETSIVATIGGRSATVSMTVTSAHLLSLTLTPPVARVSVGVSRSLHVTGVFSDNTTQDLTEMATWTSSSPEVASVSNLVGDKGTVRGVSEGDSTVSAAALGLSASSAIGVHSQVVSITVTPPTLNLPRGEEAALRAVAVMSDDTTLDVTKSVTWSSSSDGLCGVSNAPGSAGEVSAVDVGEATITASTGGVSGSAHITVTDARLVSLVLSPAAITTASGFAVPFKASGIFSDETVLDLTQSLTWTSTDRSVATVSDLVGARGNAHALAPGTTVVTARDPASGVSGSATLTVTAAVLRSMTITPARPALPNGETLAFQAIGTFSDGTVENLTGAVTWSSEQPSIVSISDDGTEGKGGAWALSPGTATISAVDPTTGVRASTTITVTSAVLKKLIVGPEAESIAKGTTLRYAATGHFSDGTTADLTSQVTWKSANAAVAQADNFPTRGLVWALSVGTTRISATEPASGIGGDTPLTVTDAVPVAIDIEPAAPTLARGRSLRMTAWVEYSDGTMQDETSLVTWHTADPRVCSVSEGAGVLLAIGTGSSTITANLGSLAGSTTVTVTPAVLVSVVITPGELSTPLGAHVQYAATGVYSDSSTQDLTRTVFWDSDTPGVVTVSDAALDAGRATSHAVGSAMVIATDPTTGIANSVKLTVTPAPAPRPAEMVVACTIPPSLRIFPAGATGNTAPLRVITGSATLLSGPRAVGIDAVDDEIFVPNPDGARVTVYDRDASGNVAPKRVISGPATGLANPTSVAVDLIHDEIVVTDDGNHSIRTFPRLANGDVPPLRIISGGFAGLIYPAGAALDDVNDEILVIMRVLTNGAWGAFRRTDSGNRFPLRTVVGSLTDMNYPRGLVLDKDDDDVLICQESDNEICVFHRTDNANLAPLRIIRGPSTFLNSPWAITIDYDTGRILVANRVGDSITAYPRETSGNVAPVARLVGPATGINDPRGVGVFPVSAPHIP